MKEKKNDQKQATYSRFKKKIHMQNQYKLKIFYCTSNSESIINMKKKKKKKKQEHKTNEHLHLSKISPMIKLNYKFIKMNGCMDLSPNLTQNLKDGKKQQQQQNRHSKLNYWEKWT